jgi:hypothetical protein
MTVGKRIIRLNVTMGFGYIRIKGPCRDNSDRMLCIRLVPEFGPFTLSEEGRGKVGTKKVRTTFFKILVK